MCTMYKLPVYVPQDIPCHPVDTIYRLPSYHANIGKDQDVADDSEFVLTDPAKLVEQKQQKLLDTLNSLTENLNRFLQSQGGAAAKVAPKPSKPATVDAPKKEEDAGRKDKGTKKEARKAAKVDAKNKVASGQPGAKPDSKLSLWTVTENKQSTETGQSLTACNGPFYSTFNKQELEATRLQVTEGDLPWVRSLAKIGDRFGIAFKGVVSNNAVNGKPAVEVVQGAEFQLTTSGRSIKGRVAAWKLLGSVFGLFSAEYHDAIQSAHQHQWLNKIDLVLSGKQDLQFVVREASQFLATFDTLGSYFNVGIADIVLRSILPEASLPNNVELWVNRLDSM